MSWCHSGAVLSSARDKTQECFIINRGCIFHLDLYYDKKLQPSTFSLRDILFPCNTSFLLLLSYYSNTSSGWPSHTHNHSLQPRFPRVTGQINTSQLDTGCQAGCNDVISSLLQTHKSRDYPQDLYLRALYTHTVPQTDGQTSRTIAHIVVALKTPWELNNTDTTNTEADNQQSQLCVSFLSQRYSVINDYVQICVCACVVMCCVIERWLVMGLSLR